MQFTTLAVSAFSICSLAVSVSALVVTPTPFIVRDEIASTAWNKSRVSSFEVPLAPLACGDTVTDSELVVEAGNYLFDQGIGCGQHIELVAPNGKVAVGRLLDYCEGSCMNLSPAFFAHLEPTAKGFLFTYWRRTDKPVGLQPDVKPFYSGSPPNSTT